MGFAFLFMVSRAFEENYSVSGISGSDKLANSKVV